MGCTVSELPHQISILRPLFDAPSLLSLTEVGQSEVMLAADEPSNDASLFSSSPPSRAIPLRSSPSLAVLMLCRSTRPKLCSLTEVFPYSTQFSGSKQLTPMPCPPQIFSCMAEGPPARIWGGRGASADPCPRISLIPFHAACLGRSAKRPLSSSRLPQAGSSSFLGCHWKGGQHKQKAQPIFGT
jgi:hypothetical protein